MSDLIKAGCPAFPVSTSDATAGHQDGHTTWQFPGMTLRDYFAAKAMHQMLHGARLPPEFDASDTFKMLADRSYEVADAMLAARES